MFNKLFGMSNHATKGLQSSTVSDRDCIDLIKGLKKNFSTFRNKGNDFDKVMPSTDLMNKPDPL